jgi:hypothetical protein
LKRAGLGFLGLHPRDFFEVTFEELQIMAEERRTLMEELERQEWARARMIGYWSFLPHIKRGRKLKPTDMMTFPWESTASNVEPISREENLRRIQERDAKIYAKQQILNNANEIRQAFSGR